MSKYEVVAECNTIHTVIVEADSEEQAVEKYFNEDFLTDYGHDVTCTKETTVMSVELIEEVE